MTNESQNTDLTLGQQLKNAREALSLSIEDVAKQTQLKKNAIESLENDIFILPNIAPAFVRGYVRNYVRFLRLPEELIGSVNYGEVTLPKESQRKVLSANNPKSESRWVKRLTILILLVAFGMTFAWWLQEYRKDQQSRETLISTNTTTTETAQTAPASTPVAPVVENSTTATTTAASTTEVAPAPTVVTNTTEATPPTAATANTTETTAPTSATAQPNAETANNTLQAVTSGTETAQPAAPASNDELRIEITNAQSWVTVRGAKNKRLAEKLYNSGEVLSFNGNEQYRLTIGAPANVKIYYQGKEVPLKIDGRVARIKLPLAP